MEVIERLAADLAAERGVLGLARLRHEPDEPDLVRLLIASEWHAFDPLCSELPRIGRTALVDSPVAELHAHDTWTGLRDDRLRIEIRVVRMSELLPSALGETAEPLHDPRGLLEQWARWSRGRPGRDTPPVADPNQVASDTLALDTLVRSISRLPPGARRVNGRGRDEAARPLLARRLRERLQAPGGSALPDELEAAAQASLGAVPLPAEGVLVVQGDREDPYERFLTTADAEGFRGDRVLFDAAAQQLAALARRAPVFDLGYCLPTFDQVEASFAVADAAGGCQTPLVPGVYVGVGVTPTDALEFWAAPSIRPAGTAYAAVADDGVRIVVARSAGLEALLEAQRERIDAAWDELEATLARARGAMSQPAGDTTALLRSLSLPRSHVELALRCLGTTDGAGRSRFDVAVALLRAAQDVPPLVARKLWLSAGRVIATSTAGPRKPGAPTPCAD